MKTLITNKGWFTHQSNCIKCDKDNNYINPQFKGYEIILNENSFAIKKKGHIISKGNSNQLKLIYNSTFYT